MTDPHPVTIPLGNAREDNELCAGLARNLDGCFELLVAAYQDRLYRFALRYCANPQDAEEITQDAFVRAYHALHAYPAERVRGLSLRPWLYTIVLNVARNRARGKHLTLVALDGHEQESEDDMRDRPESIIDRAEGTHELAALLSALPERYRAAVVLRHVEGLGYGEVAEVLDQPVGTVKANVHRGVRLLREALQRHLGMEVR
ncbi:MAG: sigma-70 family RNA polymerase sigma factor [Chloroflexota bacterium]|nr:sigma-70 family RNA polymerase sigma factor [Chloroflexota bacterium]